MKKVSCNRLCLFLVFLLFLSVFRPQLSLCLSTAFAESLATRSAPGVPVLPVLRWGEVGEGLGLSLQGGDPWGPGLFNLPSSLLPRLCLCSCRAGCRPAPHMLPLLSLPSLPGAPPSRSHVLLRSVPSLWPNPACQQLQRALCQAVPGLPGGDPALSRGGDPARTHPQLLPPEHRCGIHHLRCCWQHPE